MRLSRKMLPEIYVVPARCMCVCECAGVRVCCVLVFGLGMQQCVFGLWNGMN